jgi:hypothetical protein
MMTGINTSTEYADIPQIPRISGFEYFIAG